MTTPVCKSCSKRIADEMPAACYNRPLCLDEPDTWDDEEIPANAYNNDQEAYI